MMMMTGIVNSQIFLKEPWYAIPPTEKSIVLVVGSLQERIYQGTALQKPYICGKFHVLTPEKRCSGAAITACERGCCWQLALLLLSEIQAAEGEPNVFRSLAYK